MIEITPKMICDFCSEQPVVKEYPCRSFTMIGSSINKIPNLDSENSWMACQTCADLIDSNSWSGLLNRCMECFAEQEGKTYEPDKESFLRFSQAMLITKFRKHRIL